ncbi:MAG: glucosaminidase domain-containing protein [Chitinophagales bacterium]
MKKIIGPLLLGITMQASAQTLPSGWDYIEKYRDIAIAEMNRSGVPASITLAQGIHESSFGKSPLATEANNHFGIKCHNEWTGDRYHHDDDAPQECFRVYKSADESFRDHSDFLRTRRHYSKLFELSITDYKGWARGLKAAGYATNPKYPEIIIKLVEDYKLDNLDKLADYHPAPTAPVVAAAPEKPAVKPVATAPAPAAAKPEQRVITLDEILRDVPEVDFWKDLPMAERQVNGVKAIQFKTGMKPADIAKHYNITLENLYAYNDMKAGSPLTAGQLIYVEEKKNDCVYHQYELGEGESMHYVSQKFGIKLCELYKRNSITENCEPLPGEIVVLRGTREVPIRFKLKNQPAMVAPKVEKADARVHQVSTDDTLYSIAQRYNMDVDSLRRINGLKTNDIQIGQKLIVDL